MRETLAREQDLETATSSARQKVEVRTGSLFVLRVVSGGDRGLTLELNATPTARLYLGKSSACDLQVTDQQVSRRHAAFDVHADHVLVTDMDSTNGTFVNGVQISGARLCGGETIVVGDTRIRFEVVASAVTVKLTPATSFGSVIGASDEMRLLYPRCERISQSDVPVIIEGETGTGKEVMAESIHGRSQRAAGPFVVFDCTAVPASLMESALFGHERGAFTGAVGPRVGVFEQARDGTLLIDEIGDLEIGLQPKLLRAIQRSEIQRVGGTSWVKCNVRVIAATRRNLEQEIQAGRFRDDLFYRLAVARIELPPLRNRHGDVAVLAEHFWREQGRASEPLPADFLERLERYTWPGNVRELYNAVAHRHAMGELSDLRSLHRRSPTQGRQLDGEAGLLPAGGDAVDDLLAEGLSYHQAKHRVLAHFERRFVAWALEKYGGNISKAALGTGLARRYFYVIRGRQEL